ncbi:MAG: Gfo/Idh/MocA family oxidoreductase [Rhodospirillales bacterium]|jgi:predicted dehydrogenase|nr:Gfo/Idh/MocA family oxidoreductase [Rhodospirillales bacterium]
MSEHLSALIVGCGNIAGGYDEARTGDEVLSHAGAYGCHPRFTVSACVEPDEARRAAFMEHWNVADGFANLADCRASGMEFDVASICVPTAAHEGVLREVLGMPVRAVFCEKPLSGAVETSRALVTDFASAGRPLCVNYLRRWMADMDRVRQSIASGEWGAVQSVVGHYTKGIMNCGSHMIDLLHFLVGPLTPTDVFKKRVDFDANDPTLDALLFTQGGAPVYLVGSDSRDFFTFEIEITTQKGRVVIEDQGAAMRFRHVANNPLFPAYRVLERGEWTATDLGSAMVSAVDNLARHLDHGDPLASDGHSALEAENVCARLLELAEERLS